MAFQFSSLPFTESSNHIFDDSPAFKTNGNFSFLPWFLKPWVGPQLRKALVLLLSCSVKESYRPPARNDRSNFRTRPSSLEIICLVLTPVYLWLFGSQYLRMYMSGRPFLWQLGHSANSFCFS